MHHLIGLFGLRSLACFFFGAADAGADSGCHHHHHYDCDDDWS